MRPVFDPEKKETLQPMNFNTFLDSLKQLGLTASVAGNVWSSMVRYEDDIDTDQAVQRPSMFIEDPTYDGPPRRPRKEDESYRWYMGVDRLRRENAEDIYAVNLTVLATALEDGSLEEVEGVGPRILGTLTELVEMACMQ